MLSFLLGISFMKNVVNLYKPVGYTPLQVIEAYRLSCVQYKDTSLGYAGRLDPMAEGVLLVLVGEVNKARIKYERLPKEYEFEVLFGVRTDTYDVMGRIEEAKEGEVPTHEVKNVASEFEGEWSQKYPPYSSARVAGKPLYFWAREGKISEVEIPKKKVRVERIVMEGVREVEGREIASDSIARVEKVKGKFRQKEIISDWCDFEKKYSTKQFSVVKFRIECSSGVYVRGIADAIGRKLGFPSLAYKIKRTKVGEHDLLYSLKLGSI